MGSREMELTETFVGELLIQVGQRWRLFFDEGNSSFVVAEINPGTMYPILMRYDIGGLEGRDDYAGFLRDCIPEDIVEVVTAAIAADRRAR